MKKPSRDMTLSRKRTAVYSDDVGADDDIFRTAEQTLRSELDSWRQRCEAFSTLTGHVVYEWNVETDEVAWCGNTLSLLGYTQAELGGGLEGWLQLVHPDDRWDAQRAVETVLADRSRVEIEYRVRRKDGDYILIRDVAEFVEEPDGNRVRMVGVLSDLSRREWSENRFQAVVENAPVGVLVVDQLGAIRFANRSVLDLFEYARDDLVGQPIEVLIPQKFRDPHREYRQQYAENPHTIGSRGRELTGCTKGGAEFPVEVGLSPIDFPWGGAVICTVVDITQRVAAQRAVDEHQRRFHDILNNTSAVVYVKDLDFRYEFVNNRWTELFGMPAEEVVGKNDYDLFSEDLAGAFRHNDRRVLETGEGLQLQEIAPHSDGPHTYVSVKFPLRDADGRIRGLAGISTDISEQLAAQEELARLKHQLELILNSVSDGIYGLDTDGRTTFANRAAEQMLGLTAKDMRHRQQHELIHHALPDGRPYPAEQCPIYATIHDGTSRRVDNEVFWRPDGASFPVQYTSSPIIDGEQIVGAVVTFRDLTDRRKRQEHEQELHTAHLVQQKLYPKAPPQIPGFDVSGAVFPATQACGDYYDYIPTPDGLVVAVGDVTGHGLGPALQMVETRGFLRALLRRETDLVGVVQELNDLLVRDMPESSFISLVLAHLQRDKRTIRYVGAGHDASLVRADGAAIRLNSTSLLLGVAADAPIEDAAVPPMQSGDLLVLLTDGVTEAYSPAREPFGWKRAIDVVRSHRHQTAAEIVERLIAAVRAFVRSDSLNDDVTAVIVKAT
jgi:PAS domain S-box-containing protein